AFDHALSTLASSPLSSGIRVVNLGNDVVLASDTLPPEQVAGRLLFHDATDSRVSGIGPVAIACAGCHPGGDDDGHTWQFDTPVLRGRDLAITAPYGYREISGTLGEFINLHVRDTTGGSGVSEQMVEQLFRY